MPGRYSFHPSDYLALNTGDALKAIGYADFVAGDFERQTSGAARGNHAVFAIQHHEWLSNRVHDHMCERKSILNIRDQGAFCNVRDSQIMVAGNGRL